MPSAWLGASLMCRCLLAGRFEKGSGNTWNEAEGCAERSQGSQGKVSCSFSDGCGRVGCSCHPVSSLNVLRPAALGPLLGGMIVQGNMSLL